MNAYQDPKLLNNTNHWMKVVRCSRTSFRETINLNYCCKTIVNKIKELVHVSKRPSRYSCCSNRMNTDKFEIWFGHVSCVYSFCFKSFEFIWKTRSCWSVNTTKMYNHCRWNLDLEADQQYSEYRVMDKKKFADNKVV